MFQSVPSFKMNENWTRLVEKCFDKDIPQSQFWSAVNVLVERSHILNRKILGTETIQTFIFSCSDDIHNEIQANESFAQLSRSFSDELNKYMSSKIACYANRSNNNGVTSNFCDEHITFTVRKLISRNPDKFSSVEEYVLLDEVECSLTIWPNSKDLDICKISPTFPYKIMLNSNMIVLETYRDRLTENAAEKASEDWLSTIVLPKIFKWCCTSPSNTVPSLRLVSVKNYCKIYHYLKGKYGKKYVQMWPESSDPVKYVYEDIAIAAYLMTLWEEERNTFNLSPKQSFVDLGCGNGLLVDILSSEGHNGIGIDVRKRKIWNCYESKTKLIERAIEPSDYHIFPNYDWMIGNHSDELTPWIPVIAARSSYKMKVFLLPCCSYTFNGKYCRQDHSKTQYQSYLSFLQTLCESMGFKVQEDKLRIPSTKRICFVCSSRNYEEKEEETIDLMRKEFILLHSKKTPENSTLKHQSTHIKACDINENSQEIQDVQEKNWIPDFQPRESVECVKNCSHLDREFLNETVKIVADILLKTENYITLLQGDKPYFWNAGGKVKLKELIGLVDPTTLKSMKNQCGGFQTFLRNHRNVFSIKDGEVQLTVPSKESFLSSKRVGKKRKNYRKKMYSFKEKPCYFFFHHPQGCPLDDSYCSFSHKSG